jgi:hypothetical protein
MATSSFDGAARVSVDENGKIETRNKEKKMHLSFLKSKSLRGRRERERERDLESMLGWW